MNRPLAILSGCLLAVVSAEEPMARIEGGSYRRTADGELELVERTGAPGQEGAKPRPPAASEPPVSEKE